MRIVYSYYCLDIIHPGHLLQMKNAKRLAGKDGISIIGVLTDEAVMEKKPRPIIPFEQRMQIGEAIQYADLVVPQATYSPIPNVLKIKPDILMESMSHSEELVAISRRTMSELGGIVVLTPYYPVQSSTSIKEKIVYEKNNASGGASA